MIDTDGTFTDEFTESLPDLLGDDYYNDPETRQQPTKYFENVKDLPTLLKRAVNADRKISAHGEALKKATEGMIKIPSEGASPEEIVAYRKAQGVPDTPEEYNLTVPKEDYADIAKLVQAAAHKEGISPSKMGTVWNEVTSALVANDEALEKKGQELLEADIKALREKYKEKYDSFIQDTDKVAAQFNIKGDPALGTKDNPVGSEFMKLMDTMGIKDTPIVREFLGAIAPLVLEGSGHIGGGGAGGGGEGGGFSYEYDEKGKPI